MQPLRPTYLQHRQQKPQVKKTDSRKEAHMCRFDKDMQALALSSGYCQSHTNPYNMNFLKIEMPGSTRS